MLMAAALSALLWNLLFIPPVMTFKIERLEDALMCLFFFLVALSTGRLTSRLRIREQEEREREKKTNALFLYSRAIASAADAPSLISVALGQMSQIMGVLMAAMTPGKGTRGLELWESGGAFPMDDKEWSVAAWCLEHRRPAGRFTDTPSGSGRVLPAHDVRGTLHGRAGREGGRKGPPDGGSEGFAGEHGAQLAMALEREELRAERTPGAAHGRVGKTAPFPAGQRFP